MPVSPCLVKRRQNKNKQKTPDQPFCSASQATQTSSETWDVEGSAVTPDSPRGMESWWPVPGLPGGGGGRLSVERASLPPALHTLLLHTTPRLAARFLPRCCALSLKRYIPEWLNSPDYFPHKKLIGISPNPSLKILLTPKEKQGRPLSTGRGVPL